VPAHGASRIWGRRGTHREEGFCLGRCGVEVSAPDEKRPTVSETEDPRAGNSRTDLLDEVLVLSGGLSEADRSRVLDHLSTLETHLSRWDPADVTVEVSVKNRDGREQQVTLRADLPGHSPLVAKVVDPNLDSALASAQRELVRQVEDEKKKREPKSNRRLRNKPI
jgi:ribosome-associated translation inhibitor RaiA